MPRHTKEVDRLAAAIASGSALERNTSRPLAGERSSGKRLPLAARLVLFFGGRPGKVAQNCAMRRSWPIVGYVGPNGGGKSLAMILDTLDTLNGVRWECDNPSHLHTQRGQTSGYRTVLSTVRLFDPLDGYEGDRWDRPTHPLYVPFTNFAQLVDAEHCDVLMDEVVGIASSREAQRLDVRVQNVLVQLRRRDVLLRWSAPNWARADRIIREVTQLVVECRGFYADRSSLQTDSVQVWAPKRVFKFTAFDTFSFDEWTAGKKEKIESEGGHWFRGAGSTAFRAYDTLDAVMVVEQLSPDGLCPHCGLPQRREYCAGHDEAGHAVAARRQRRVRPVELSEAAELEPVL